MVIKNKKQNHQSDLFICLNPEVELEISVMSINCSDFTLPDRLLIIAVAEFHVYELFLPLLYLIWVFLGSCSEQKL